MSYSYETEKPWLFTDQGSRVFAKARDGILGLLRKAGAFREDAAYQFIPCGDPWQHLAILDRMVEIGDLVRVSTRGIRQHYIYTESHGRSSPYGMEDTES